MLPLRELRLEVRDDFFDPIQDERQRVEYWATLSPRAAFTELYADGRVRLHLHLRTRRHSHSGDRCAVFGYHPVSDAFYTETSNTDGRLDTWCATPHSKSGGQPHERRESGSRISDLSGAMTGRGDYAYAREVGGNSDDLNGAMFVSVVDVGQDA
jgi:hypothetical protein